MLTLLLNPLIEILLVAVIFISIMAEIKTAGFSGAGLIAVAAIILLFSGHWYMGDMTMVEGALLLGGFVLVLLDIYLLMSGAMAVAGMVSIAAGMYFIFGADTAALYILAAGIIVSIIGIYLLAGILPESRLWKRISLKNSTKGYKPSQLDYSGLIGKEGVAESVLRPSGRVRIGNEVIDAVTHGTFIEKGEKVRITAALPGSVVVEKISE